MTWEECKYKIEFLLRCYNCPTFLKTNSYNWGEFASQLNSCRYFAYGYYNEEAGEMQVYLSHILSLMNHDVSIEGYCG